MINRLAGASFRAALVATAVLGPALALPGVSNSSAELAILSAAIAAAFVIIEYGFQYPSMIEFRFAAPYNRVRFGMFAAIVGSLTVVFRQVIHDGGTSLLVTEMATAAFELWDFPGSPVRAFLSMAGPMSDQNLAMIGAAAAIAMTITVFSLGVFAATVAAFAWPMTRDTFNLWVNMPTFETQTGAEAQDTLRQSAFISMVIGLTLPYLAPYAAIAFMGPLQPVSAANSLLLVWMIATWCFVPAVSILRAVALYKVASVLAEDEVPLG